MFTATFYPDATPGAPVLLCNTSRSLTELNVVLNHKQIMDHVPGYGAAFDLAIDMGNDRNLLSFDVRRDSDYAPAKFVDVEAAFLFAMDHPPLIRGTGILKIVLAGVTTSATRWLLNAYAETLSMPDWLGIAPLFKYSFNGGQITATNPF